MFNKYTKSIFEERFAFMAGNESAPRAPERNDRAQEKPKEADSKQVASRERAAATVDQELEAKQYELAARKLEFAMGRVNRIANDPRLTGREKSDKAKPFIEELAKAGFTVAIKGERGDIIVVTPPDTELACPTDFSKQPGSPDSRAYLAGLVRERGIRAELPTPQPETAVANSGY